MYFVRSQPSAGRYGTKPRRIVTLRYQASKTYGTNARRIGTHFAAMRIRAALALSSSPPALSAASLPVRPPLVLPFTPRSSSAASLQMSGLHRHAARPAAPLFTLPAGALLWLHVVVRHRLARHSIPLWKSTGIVLTCTTLASRLHRHDSRWPRSSAPAWPVDRVPPRVQAHQD